ncbi:uncharacterized protein BT62DRAFT_935820, partial [Guyanagaster necrorhizus]
PRLRHHDRTPNKTRTHGILAKLSTALANCRTHSISAGLSPTRGTKTLTVDDKSSLIPCYGLSVECHY